MGGIENLFFLRRLLADLDSQWDRVVAHLEAIRQHLFSRTGMIVNVTLDAANWSAVEPKVKAFIDSLPEGSGTRVQWTPQYLDGGSEALTIPAQVNYVGKGANLYDLGYELNGAGYVVPRWLGTDWLWERVRMMGGAYGGFAAFDPFSGVFSYLSYRDPNLLETLENYDGAAAYLRSLDLNESEITKAIIGAISDVDSYQLPDAKGYSQMLRYLTGVSDERRQTIRDSILSTTVADFHHFGEVLGRLNDAARVVVLGSEDAINAVNGDFPGMLRVTKVL
jgi:hypothetical protein